jgi:hypothetical protein
MTSLSIATSPATATPTPAPVPPNPKTPQDVLDAVAKPLFRGEYTATETDTWTKGVPLFGTKVSSSRPIAFSNEFNVLDVGEKMVGFQATTLDDAIRGAADLAFDWSDPAIGGGIYASVGVAILQGSDGNYYSALVGSGNPKTSTSALGYRSDRFDNNIYGKLKHATDAKPTGSWSAPVDKHGKPVDVPAPSNDAPITRRHVEDIKVGEFVPATPLLKAIVDIKNVFRIGEQAAPAAG